MTLHWFKSYESRRVQRFNQERRLSKPKQLDWTSDKYDFSDSRVQFEFVPEENCTVGACIGALRKLWRGYNEGQDGEREYCAWKINQIQKSLGIQISTFPETEGMESESKELTADEIQAKKEEREENGGEYSISPNTEISDEEWSEEDKTLLREEIEAERENDW